MVGARWWLLCFSFMLLVKICSGLSCNVESYQKLRRQCTQVLHEKVTQEQGDLIRNCRDFTDFEVCLRDSWRIACEGSTAPVENNDTLALDMKRKYFSNCLRRDVMANATSRLITFPKNSSTSVSKSTGSDGRGETSALSVECRPDKAVKKLLNCGSQFYDMAVHVSNKRSAISLSSLCPEVEKYGLCAHKVQNEVNCSLGYQMVPHMKYVAENIVQRYRLLCTALRKSAFQKGTTACDRQKFINDMFLCGYHFANVAEVVGTNAEEVCAYIQKYRECHNTSVVSYGCAPPDHLVKDAEKFFVLLTQKYNRTCPSQGRARSSPRTSRLTLNEDVAYTCDGNRFIRYFFQCAAGFVNATKHMPKDLQHICRVVSIYRHCVNGARHATHCNTRMELNTHLSYMQNFIMEQYEPMCTMRRGKTPRESDPTEMER